MTGDCNLDRRVDISDAIQSLTFQFQDNEVEICYALCDVDRDGLLSVSDAIALLNVLFIDEGTLPPHAQHPVEICDGLDNDCDGEFDEGCLDTSGASLGLAWDAVSTDADGEPENLRGYRLYIGVEPGDYMWVREVGALPQARIEGLLPGQTYFFAVSAVDIHDNESRRSGEVAATTSMP